MSVLAEGLRWRARECAELGSPLYAGLLAAAADDLDEGGPVADVLGAVVPPDADLEWVQDTGIPLRLMASVHRLVLEGALPDLAAHYSAGDAAFPSFREALRSHRDRVVEGLARPPQTNEVGRAAVLVGGLLHLAARVGLPVRLWELGTSGGLNLRADHFLLDLGEEHVGPADSPVVLSRPWIGEAERTWPPRDARPEVVERRGCDPDPIDPTTPEGELRLRSCVWPDQPRRHRLLSGAVELARRVPAEVVPAGAGAFLEDLQPEPGTVTLVWHSITRKYVEDTEWRRVTGHLDRAAAAARPDAPVAHLAFEPRRQPDGIRPFLARLRLWPPGEARTLARAHPHGTWVRWLAGA